MTVSYLTLFSKDKAVFAAFSGTLLLIASMLLFSPCFNLRSSDEYGTSCAGSFALGMLSFAAAIQLCLLGVTQMPFSLHLSLSRLQSGERDVHGGGGGYGFGGAGEKLKTAFGTSWRLLAVLAAVYLTLWWLAMTWLKAYVYLMIDAHANHGISPVKTLVGAMFVVINTWLLINVAVTLYYSSKRDELRQSSDRDEDVPLLVSADKQMTFQSPADAASSSAASVSSMASGSDDGSTVFSMPGLLIYLFIF